MDSGCCPHWRDLQVVFIDVSKSSVWTTLLLFAVFGNKLCIHDRVHRPACCLIIIPALNNLNKQMPTLCTYVADVLHQCYSATGFELKLWHSSLRQLSINLPQPTDAAFILLLKFASEKAPPVAIHRHGVGALYLPLSLRARTCTLELRARLRYPGVSW
jgi:hypothetical protein